jgi:hypothetical protein
VWTFSVFFSPQMAPFNKNDFWQADEPALTPT